jgi:hypothetical protein
MPAEQKAIFEEKRRYELENQKLLEQNESYRSQAMQEMARTVNYEVDSELGKVNYSPIKDAYDKAYGSGAFRNLVLDRGAILVERAGRHVPPSEVIAMVAKEFAPFISQTQGTATSVQGTEPVAQHTNQTNQPKIIPQVGKGSGSATRGAVSSIDDLRKLKAAAM